MNIEELKLILDTINTIAGGATDLALVWIVVHYVLNFLTVPLAISCFGTAVYFVVKLLVATNEWAEIGKQVARAYGSDPSSFVYSTDRSAIERAIFASKEARK